MGFYNNSSNIKCFEPDNDENNLYIPAGSFDATLSMQDILDDIKNHFGDISLDSLTISAEHIHAKCIGYDMYDPWDYTEFLHISKR